MLPFLSAMMPAVLTDMMPLAVVALAHAFVMTGLMMTSLVADIVHNVVKLQSLGLCRHMMMMLRLGRVSVFDMVDQENLQAVARLFRRKDLRGLRLGLGVFY